MTATNRKWIVFVVLLVFLSFPRASHELSFKFLDNDDDNGKESITMKKKNDLPERKFKFHKIQRISIEEEEDDDDENDEDVDKNESNHEYNDNDELPNDETVYSKHQESNDVIGNNVKEDEIKFERVHRAQKQISQLENTENESSKKLSRKSKDANAVSEGTFVSSLVNGLSGLFQSIVSAASGNVIQFIRSDKSPNDGAGDESNHPSKQENGIIPWLKWLGEKTGRITAVPPARPPTSTSTDGWLAYLNRWPFNSFFPFEKPANRRSAAAGRRSAKNSEGDDAAAGGCLPYSTTDEPISQKHFEALLHTLPGFVINVSHIHKDALDCKQQIQIFHRQLRGNKLWTLQMLDATAKIPSGLLRGNINQFGDFDLCMQTKTIVRVTPEESVRIRGKYCMAHIEAQTAVSDMKVPLHMVQGRTLWNGHLGNPGHFVPRYSIANWGICIPHLCTAAVVQEMIQNNLKPYNVSGLEFHIEVKDKDCYSRQSKQNFVKLIKTGDNNVIIKVIIAFIGILLLIIVAALIADYWQEFGSRIEKFLATEEELEGPKEESSNVVQKTERDAENGENVDTIVTDLDTQSLKNLLLASFKSFSPRHTYIELLTQSRNDTQFPIVHLLKLCATLMLYICLKYMMIGHLPITNRDALVHSVRQPLSIVFRSPMLYSDILLLVSGFIIAFQLSAEMEEHNCIHLLKRLAAKTLRYLPTVYLVLTFQTWLLPHLGSGPLWTNIISQQSSLCEKQMWRNIFSVQNAIDIEETCSPMTIQLALEMQLYLLCPLIVWLYYTDSDAGFFVYGAVHAMSVAARFSRTNREQLSATLFHGMNISKFYRTANTLYASPISRATPYLMGVGAGLLQRTQAGEFNLSAKLITLGWLLSAASIGWCFWAPSTGMRTDFVYSATEAASYASWSSLLLGLALVWIILMCPRSEESRLHTICSSRPVLFLSRISFPMQMVAYIVVLYNTASIRDARKYNVNNLFDVYEISLIIILASAVAFLIDVPMQNIRRLCVDYIFKERSTQERKQEEEEEEPISGTEPSEAELSEERSENLTCDTPEPPDTIWSTIGEEEEEDREMLFKRRSSKDELEAGNDDRYTENTYELQTPMKGEQLEDIQQLPRDERVEGMEIDENSEALSAEDTEENPEEVKTIENACKDDAVGEEEEEDEDDIGEDDEIKKRPSSPIVMMASTATPPTPIVSEERESFKSTLKPRRRLTSEEN